MLVPESLYSHLLGDFDEPHELKLKRLRRGILAGNLPHQVKNLLSQDLSRQIYGERAQNTSAIPVRHVGNKQKKKKKKVQIQTYQTLPPSLFQPTPIPQTSQPNADAYAGATAGPSAGATAGTHLQVSTIPSQRLQVDQPQDFNQQSSSLRMSSPLSFDEDLEPRTFESPLVRNTKHEARRRKEAIARAIKNLRRMPDLTVLQRPGSKRSSSGRTQDEWISILRPKKHRIHEPDTRGEKRTQDFRLPSSKRSRTIEHTYIRGEKRSLENPRYRPSKYARWETWND
jgi:hypothetical protein